MIDRKHRLPMVQQCQILELSRSSVYYVPQPVSAADLALMRQIDELHLQYPFAGSRMLRDILKLNRVSTGMQKCTTLPGMTWQPSRATEEVAMVTEEVFMDVVALHRQGHSMRFIAKRLGLHRNTVKKYILGKRFPEYRRTEKRLSILAPFVRIIQDWASQDNYRASWIFDRLKQIGYTGGYDTVKSFVRPLKEQQSRIAYSRFETMPGLQAPVDWADFKITEPSGRTSTVYLFLMVLGCCRAM